MRNTRNLFFLFLCLLWVVLGANVAHGRSGYRQWVVPVSAHVWQCRLPEDTFTRQVQFLLRQNNKFILNQWYHKVKRFDIQRGRYLDFGGNTEHFIRPVSHAAFTLALCLKLDVYDEGVTGVSRKKATSVVCRLVRSLAYRHKIHSGTDGWGDQWQSALWAAQVAEAAWLVWDRLSKTDRELVCRMMVHEADRFLAYEIPYYRDKNGNILFKGDTKAEENAWNSNILTIATAMMPKAPHYEKWMKKNIELQLSAYAAPADLHKDMVVDGVKLSEFLQGSNVNEDGTVVNHSIIHPDYMVAFMHNGTNAWVYDLAGIHPLQASTYNGDLVYRALTELEFNGKTIYQKTQDGHASPVMYYPQGNDWGTGRQENYWLMDVMAYVFGWGAGQSVKAIDWAEARNKRMVEMMKRSSTGEYYREKSENSFSSREEWFGAQIAWGYLGWWIHRCHLDTPSGEGD